MTLVVSALNFLPFPFIFKMLVTVALSPPPSLVKFCTYLSYCPNTTS